MKDRQRGYARKMNAFLMQLREILTQIREMDEYYYGKVFASIKLTSMTDDKKTNFENTDKLNDDNQGPPSLRSEPMAPLSPSMYKAMQSDKGKLKRSKSHRSAKSTDSAKSTHVSYITYIIPNLKFTFVTKI